jgi:hypothetical protein
MNLSEEQFSRHAENVTKKKDRVEILEAILATHDVTGVGWPPHPAVAYPFLTPDPMKHFSLVFL